MARLRASGVKCASEMGAMNRLAAQRGLAPSRSSHGALEPDRHDIEIPEEPEEIAQGRFASGGIERGQRLDRRGVRGDLGDRAAAVDESDDRPLDRIERHRALSVHEHRWLQGPAVTQ